MSLKRKMTGIKELQLGVGVVTKIGLCAGFGEEWIMAAPDDQRRRQVLPKVFLEFRVQSNIALVVPEQVKLQLDIAGPAKQRPVERPSVRAEPLDKQLRKSGRILQPNTVRAEPAAQFLAIFCGRYLPIGLESIPVATEPFLVGIAILDDQRCHPFRMEKGQSQSNRRAIILNVKAIAIETEGLRKVVDDAGIACE
jgi:hypothetical protein